MPRRTFFHALWVVLALVTALALSRIDWNPAPVEDTAPAAPWEALGLKGPEADFDGRLEGLSGVVLDPPPEVGSDYHPTFPPDREFDAKTWLTTTPSPTVAEPRAIRGGTLRLAMESYPPTLRTEGPNARLKTLSDIHGLIYESLLGYDMVLGDFVPGLASHWQIEKDRITFRFRLDPKARWADGSPVTSDDVKATFEHLMNDDRRDPALAQTYRELVDTVEILDRQTVEIRAKEPQWRALLTIAGTNIYPAAYIRMDGDTYLTDWNWKLPPGSGPYELGIESLKKGSSITVHRRQDYWDEQNPYRAGTYNFEAIRWAVIRDEELMYQKFLAGEIDVYPVYRAQRWVDEIDREEAIRNGWIQKRKVYTLEPQGYGGYAFNMRVRPFNSRNVRLAFAHLFNREQFFEKFFFYQYEYIDSYFPGQIWARPDRPRVRYNPTRSRELLAQDGWVERDSAGYLVNRQGQRFPTLTLEFASPSLQRIFAATADDLWREAGIKLTLKLVDAPSLLKKVWDQKFQLVYWNWTASLFPDMEFQFHSKFADDAQSNNLNGFMNPQADRLMEEYKTEFDFEKRKQLMQRLDEILFEEHVYALGWYAPFYRLLYWDFFGHPPEYGDRYGGDVTSVMRYWWFDPERQARTLENRSRGIPNHPDRPDHQYDAVEHRYWLEHELPMGEEAQ
ncbi:MAG: hypothetical protein HY319_30275 [Armatimonadetes bacterium]|nr:hypothetical protein [Armatimonadota bacterium]